MILYMHLKRKLRKLGLNFNLVTMVIKRDPPLQMIQTKISL